MVTWCSDSGERDQKSHIIVGDFRLVSGSRFWVWMKSPNFNGSRIKKTGVLFPVISQLPSSVYNFSANPRGSRAVSAEPFSPPTVENRRKVGVFLPTCENIFAGVYFVISALLLPTYPWAPE